MLDLMNKCLEDEEESVPSVPGTPGSPWRDVLSKVVETGMLKRSLSAQVRLYPMITIALYIHLYKRDGTAQVQSLGTGQAISYQWLYIGHISTVYKSIEIETG